jgi:hypothetical protein
VFIGIAVAGPDRLEPIPGAIPSIQRLGAWARSQRYSTEIITDSDKPVTSSRLKRAFERKLGDGGQDRVIVAFAGHGLIRGGAEEYWLLNDWRSQATEAVNYFKMRDRLATYQIAQLAIISDACRSLPNSEARFVEGNGVVPIKDYNQKPVQTADWYGTQSAQPAYSSPLTANEAYCFFSRVLTDALLGIPSDVADPDPEMITVRNDALMSVVERELPRLASRYDRRQVPDLRGSWRASPDNIWSQLNRSTVAKIPPAAGVPLPERRRFGVSSDRLRQESLDRESSNFESLIKRSLLPARGTGIGLANSKLRQLFLGPGCQITGGGPQWAVVEIAGPSASFCLDLENGDWAAGAIYRDFNGTLTAGDYGIDAYVLRSVRENSMIAAGAVARASTGHLLGRPYDVAAQLRETKHIDPVYGALASYLYARGSEVDEIRRLLYFYGERGQPAPFDCVLLARVEVEQRDGGWIAKVPAVAERMPRSPIEAQRRFTFEATSATEVQVAGGFPWLRQGWALLEDDFRADFRKLHRFARGLAPSTFTAFTRTTGQELASLISRGEV